jgi:membrane-associated phospholipid phosphatase
MAGSDGTYGRPAAPTPPAPGSLAPPWAPVAAALAILFTVALSGRVWHSTGLPGVDAWMLDLLGAQSDERQLRLATEVASGLRALTVAGILATPSSPGGFFGGGARSPWPYWAPAATLAAERLLKLLVARPAPGSLVFQYPSGHVAVATALVLSLVLILRPAMARPRVKLSIGLSRS